MWGNPFVCWVSLFSIEPGSKRNWSHFQARRNWLNLFYFPNSNKWNSLSSLCARFCSWKVAARGGKERKTPKQENRVEMYFRSLLDVFPCARSWLSFPSPLGKLVFAMCTRGLLWASVACSSPRKSTGWEIFPACPPPLAFPRGNSTNWKRCRCRSVAAVNKATWKRESFLGKGRESFAIVLFSAKRKRAHTPHRNLHNAHPQNKKPPNKSRRNASMLMWKWHHCIVEQEHNEGGWRCCVCFVWFSC